MTNSQYIKNSYLDKKIESIELFIEADKLHSIQVSFERFLEKWTEKNVVNLEIPKQFEKRKKLINFTQWVNRFSLAGGGILTLNDHPKIGGSISILYPLVELLISFLREKIERRSNLWEGFFRDSERLANELDRLLTITDSIRSLPLVKLNSISKKLNDKVYDFLKEYDENQDRKIDISELKIDKFVKDLKKKWSAEKEKKIREIVRKMKVLQKEVISYRRCLYIQGTKNQ